MSKKFNKKEVFFSQAEITFSPIFAQHCESLRIKDQGAHVVSL